MTRSRSGAALAALLFGAILLAPLTAQAAKIRVGLGDVPSVETLHLLVAFERAKEKGVEIELKVLKSEDIAAQAIVGGQMDVGVGAPYALIQKIKAPIRMFVQLSKLRFFPIVNTEYYKTWKDLDGQEIAVHSRGSGTEAIMRLMAKKHGISFSNISYIPGSEVRAGALLKGTTRASIVDATGRQMLMEKAPGKFIVLPVGNVSATDETLFANTEFLKSEPEAVRTLLETIITTWREVVARPESIVELREKYKLLPDMPAGQEEEILPYYKELATSGAIPLNGGGENAAEDDFQFYTISGALEGKADSLKVEDFWDFTAVSDVVEKLGRK